MQLAHPNNIYFDGDKGHKVRTKGHIHHSLRFVGTLQNESGKMGVGMMSAELEGTAMNSKKGIAVVLVLIALLVFAVTISSRKYFSPIGGTAISLFALWGAYAFGKDDKSKEGRS